MYRKLYESEERKRRNKKSRFFSREKERHEKTQQIISKLPKKDWVEVDYTMDGSVKQLFLNLTKMQIPFNYEKTLGNFFPEDMEVDEHGNFFKKIGENDIMFCGHLDTYCREYKRVWHVIKSDTIETDGTTTLGGDDKAGITVMIKMMEADVPGLYYFFRGEEGVTSPTGTWGSKQAIKSRKDFFSNIKKCIAFDRKGTSSIISEQMYTQCCSDEFVKALEEEFKKNGLEYKDDPTGMWCDSGVFMEMVPECTNISVGYKFEHTFYEEQNIVHLEKLIEAVIKINWESLPVKRDPSKVTRGIGRYNFDYEWGWDAYSTADPYGRGNKYKRGRVLYYPATTTTSYKPEEKRRDYVKMDEMFEHVVEMLSDMDYDCLNANDFAETEEMYFSNTLTNDFFAIRIIDYDIYMSVDETLKKYTNIGKLDDFRKYVMSGIHPSDMEVDEDENDLDKELDRKINSEARRDLDNELRMRLSANTQPIGIDADDEAKRAAEEDMQKDSKKKISKKDYNYTEEQMEGFSLIAETYPELVIEVMDDITSTNKKTLHSNLWIDIDKKISELGYKSDYNKDGTGINPDNFQEWVADNWVEMTKIVDDYQKTNTTTKEKSIDKKLADNKIERDKAILTKRPGSFLSTLKHSDIHLSKYHYDQFQIFSNIIEHERVITKMVLKDFEIKNKAEVRDSLLKRLWDTINSIDYKRTDKTLLTAYPQNFVDWVYEYSDEIKKYYGIKKDENIGKGVSKDESYEVVNAIYERLNKYVKNFAGMDYDHTKKTITFKDMEKYTDSELKQIREIIEDLGTNELKNKFYYYYHGGNRLFGLKIY